MSLGTVGQWFLKTKDTMISTLLAIPFEFTRMTTVTSMALLTHFRLLIGQNLIYLILDDQIIQPAVLKIKMDFNA